MLGIKVLERVAGAEAILLSLSAELTWIWPFWLSQFWKVLTRLAYAWPLHCLVSGYKFAYGFKGGTECGHCRFE